GTRVVLQETPATPALLKHRPGAVAQSAQRRPQLLRQTQQPADAQPDRRAVRDHDQQTILIESRRPARDRISHTGADFADVLPAGRLPGFVFDRPPCLDLLAGQPFPGAAAALPQILVDADAE